MAAFKNAFAEARKAGKKTFSWNGNKYTTELAKESKLAPNTSPKPKAKPENMPGKAIHQRALAKAGGPKTKTSGPDIAQDMSTSPRPKRKPENMPGIKIRTEAAAKREAAKRKLAKK